MHFEPRHSIPCPLIAFCSHSAPQQLKARFSISWVSVSAKGQVKELNISGSVNVDLEVNELSTLQYVATYHLPHPQSLRGNAQAPASSW